jgi:anti-sigma-K factor RskA
MVTHDQVIELIPAFALDCLDSDEEAAVLQHLDSCSECQAELRAYRAVVDHLPLATPDAVPSTAIKKGLMKRIDQSVQQSGLVEVKLVEPKPSLWARISDRLRSSSPAWSLASLALVVVLLVSNLVLLRQVYQPKGNGGQTALRVVNLTGTNNAPQATGMIVISENGEQGTMVVDQLPALTPDRAYQLWLIKDGKRTSGGVFSVDYEGYASLWVSAPEPLADYTSFGITIEPAGGSPGPTGQKVLGGNF